MRFLRATAFLDRPAPRALPFHRDLGRLAVFLFGLEVVTGSLLALYYRPVPEGAYESVGAITSTVTLGWLVRGLHRVTAHALVLVTGLYLARMFFRRTFLRPDGAAAWATAVALSFVGLAFLLTGEVLPWDDLAFWRTRVTANLVGEVPLVGGWLASVFRGGEEISGLTLVRLAGLHGLLLPWLAFGGLLLARGLRRRGAMP